MAEEKVAIADFVGSCLCGTVRFAVKGDFDSFYQCHCQHCQKDTGTAHAANLFSQSAVLTWQSGAEAVTSFTLPGTRHRKSFCKVCGSALPGTQIAGLLVVPAGCLDTETSVVPTAHIFLSSKAAWEGHLGEVPTFEGAPT
ncbi:MAG: GFA family protein [Saccharospirillum sp.]|uniref:GFA family protein n=1 Tax=Saccharospirillum sp. TaxID=2033801 RepID=UPI00329A4CF1